MSPRETRTASLKGRVTLGQSGMVAMRLTTCTMWYLKSQNMISLQVLELTRRSLPNMSHQVHSCLMPPFQ